MEYLQLGKNGSKRSSYYTKGERVLLSYSGGFREYQRWYMVQIFPGSTFTFFTSPMLTEHFKCPKVPLKEDSATGSRSGLVGSLL
jgi:hypothetical protein